MQGFLASHTSSTRSRSLGLSCFHNYAVHNHDQNQSANAFWQDEQVKNLTNGQFWETDGRSFDREGEVVRSKRGFYIGFNGQNVWDRPKSFIQVGCSPRQSVR